MKNLKAFLIILGFAVVFSSCSKDDDDDFTILGKWNVESLTTKTTVGDINEVDKEEGGWVEFKADGTASNDDGQSGTWSLTGNTLIVEFEEDEDEGLGAMAFNLTTKTNKRVVGEYKIDTMFMKLEVIVILVR